MDISRVISTSLLKRKMRKWYLVWPCLIGGSRPTCKIHSIPLQINISRESKIHDHDHDLPWYIQNAKTSNWSRITDHEIKLSAISVRQKKESNNGSVQDFVVERLSVQLKEGRIDLDVVTTSEDILNKTHRFNLIHVNVEQFGWTLLLT